MTSHLYECRVMHHRFTPKAHQLLYRIFLFAIDLDDLPALSRRLTFFSLNRANVYSFREGDYLPTNAPLHRPGARAPSTPASVPARKAACTLKQRVVDYLAAHDVDLTGGRVILVTLPRVFGRLFNPVSFYFCYDRSGEPVAALAEVTNTFREMKPYFLGPGAKVLKFTEGRDGTTEFRRRTPKYFYVSPYSDVDIEFDFILRPPSGRLAIQIDDFNGPTRTLTSTLTGTRHALTNTRLAWFTLKYPLITLKIISLIHWHALLLWMKRVPWFAKAARAGDQRELYHPHSSLSSPASPKAEMPETAKANA